MSPRRLPCGSRKNASGIMGSLALSHMSMSDDEELREHIYATAETWVDNPFTSLLGVSLTFAHLATQPNHHPEIPAMLARSSILHAVFALECAANSCIAVLPKQTRLRDQAEKWEPLDKFDLFLLSLPHQPNLPRGDKIVQHVRELIKIRNDYVHPRTRHHPIQNERDERSQPVFSISIQGSALLDIPSMPMTWNAEDAKRAIAAVVDFLRLYFVEVCHFAPSQITKTLFTMIESPEGHRVANTSKLHLQKLGQSLGLDLSFLGASK